MRRMGPYWILLVVAIAAIFTLPVAVLMLVPAPLSGRETHAPLLVVSVASDQETYLPGQAVIVTVGLTNAGDGIASVLFDTSCLASFSVVTTDGSLVYDHRAHVACGQILTNLTLQPGDSRHFTFSWNQATDQGIPVPTFRSYTIQGVLLSAKPLPRSSAETTIFIMRGSSGPDLAFSARTDRDSYGPGEWANVTVTLTNIGLDPVEMHFATPCFVQFVVLDEGRTEIFNSSLQWACVQIIADMILPPGESRSHVFFWGLTTDAGDPLAAGQSYEVVPSFLWIYWSSYQRYVSRTDVATFAMAAFTV